MNNSLLSVDFDALGLFPGAVQRGIVALHHAMEDVLSCQQLRENETSWPSQEIPRQ